MQKGWTSPVVYSRTRYIRKNFRSYSVPFFFFMFRQGSMLKAIYQIAIPMQAGGLSSANCEAPAREIGLKETSWAMIGGKLSGCKSRGPGQAFLRRIQPK
jgi:hypothetical protein